MNKLLRQLVFVGAALATTPAMAGATFYALPDFGGQPFTVNGAVADFRAYGFNDLAMSAVVDTPTEVCADIHFSGGCQVLNPGTYNHLGVWIVQISSARPAYGQAYDQRGYQPRVDEPPRYDQRRRDGDERARRDRRGY